MSRKATRYEKDLAFVYFGIPAIVLGLFYLADQLGVLSYLASQFGII